MLLNPTSRSTSCTIAGPPLTQNKQRAGHRRLKAIHAYGDRKVKRRILAMVITALVAMALFAGNGPAQASDTVVVGPGPTREEASLT